MPNFDRTGSQGREMPRGRQFGRCNSASNGCGHGRRHRHQRHGAKRFLLVGATGDRPFVESCIARLQVNIRAMQMRINELKSLIGE